MLSKNKLDAQKIIHHRRDDESEEFGNQVVDAEYVCHNYGNAVINKKTKQAHNSEF